MKQQLNNINNSDRTVLQKLIDDTNVCFVF